MAGTLLVSNVHFDSAGSTRIDYVNNDGVVRIASNAIKIPTGNTSSRPNDEEGLLRYNNEIGIFEGRNASSWGTISGGGGPTILPVLTRLGSTVNITVGNGLIAILTRTGATVNVAVN